MKLSDLFYLTFQSLKKRRSRFLFTVLGIAVGISAVLFLVSLGYGLQKLLLERITTKESLLTLDVFPPETEVVSLDKETLKEIKKLEGVEKVSPQAILPGQISMEDFVSQATVNIIDENFFSLSGLTAKEGRLPKKGEKSAIILNPTLAQLFGKSEKEMLNKSLSLVLFITQEDEEGQTLRFNFSHSFKVEGIVGEEGEPPQAYILFDAFEKELPFSSFQAVKVKAVNNDMMETLRNNLLEKGFIVSALSDTIEQANKVFRAVQIVLAIFGIIGLIVAAIGLINTMTISLLERTNEIGILRAIGASSRDILILFLAESAIIGLWGGILGILLGIGFAELFNYMINILAVSLGGEPVDLFFYPMWFIVFILGLSAFVGLVAGIFPAKRAANLNPLAALRYK